MNINAIYTKIYIYIIDASGTLRSRGFFENDTPDALLPKNAPAPFRVLATLIATNGLVGCPSSTWFIKLLDEFPLNV